MHKTQLWTVALSVALGCAVGWFVVPGECVVRPAGTSGTLLPGSLLGHFLHPFTVDESYPVQLFLKLSPIIIVILAGLHWRSQFGKLRAVTAFYALLVSAGVAFSPYRVFSDVELIAIVGVWGIVVLAAYESKASPGSAMLALMPIQVLMSEMFSGLGVDRGLPFWLMTVSMSIVFSYGLFHYTRTLRHGVLGRITVIQTIDPESMARRDPLVEQRRRLEGQN